MINCNRCNSPMNHLNGLKGHGHGICDACLTRSNQVPISSTNGCINLIQEIFNSSATPDDMWFEMVSTGTGESIHHLKNLWRGKTKSSRREPPHHEDKDSGYTKDIHLLEAPFSSPLELQQKIYKVKGDFNK